MKAAEEYQARFFDTLLGKRLLAFVAERNPAALENCFYLDWVPDQGEDYYWLIVDGDELFKVSIDRQTDDIVLEHKRRVLPQQQHVGSKRRGQAILRLARQRRKELREQHARQALMGEE